MGEDSIVGKVVAFIEDNLDEDLSLDEVAGEAGYSKFHLNRLFCEQVGCTIYKYIQARRISEAARKLVQTGEPIVDIALAAGYGSQQAFTNAFSQLYLCSPQAYRLLGAFVPVRPRFTSRLRVVQGGSPGMRCAA